MWVQGKVVYLLLLETKPWFHLETPFLFESLLERKIVEIAYSMNWMLTFVQGVQ